MQAINDALEQGSQPSGPPFRPQPNTIEEAGLDFAQLVDLCIKTLRYGGRMQGRDISINLKLPYKVVEVALAFLKREQLIETVGSQGMTEQQYEYVLTEKGYGKATEALERNQYVGPAPVPLEQYVETVKEQSIRQAVVTPEGVRSALSDLELSHSVRRLIGAAVNGGHSILLYGKPGNGKSSIAKRITSMLGGSILIPYAVDVGGQTIRIFDPRVHSTAEDADDVIERRSVNSYSGSMERRRDQRWVTANRPLITVGGELMIHDLDLKYSPQTKYYLAPVQMLANGGILVIDDFGRQKMRPDELLNRWIVPMEDGIDHYALLTGETIEVPFEFLLIFSTNLRPENLGDEAFWRRIRHKVEVPDPTTEIYLEILKLICARHSIPYLPEGADYLIEKHYRSTGRPYRAVHPRDLIGLMLDMGGFEGVRPELTPEWIDAACAAYFLEDSMDVAGS